MKEIENVEPSGIDADRRQVLKYMGSSALALGVMSTIPFARANTMSNEMPEGANNFYTSDLVAVQKVNFPNQYGMKIVGNLILPKNRDASKKLPAIVVGHPMGAVKEQSANLYATKMAEQGFAAMAIDLPFWGDRDSHLDNDRLGGRTADHLFCLRQGDRRIAADLFSPRQRLTQAGARSYD